MGVVVVVENIYIYIYRERKCQLFQQFFRGPLLSGAFISTIREEENRVE